MLTLQAVTPTSLTSVDDSLTLNAPDLTTDQVTAAAETHLYVQTVAKAIAQQNGLNIKDPSLYGKVDWYNALTSAITEYADWVEITGSKNVTVNNSTHSGSINLSAIMGSIMTLYLGPAAAAEWSTLNDLLGGATDPAITNFMNFWWSLVSKSTTDTGLSVGPNTETSDGQVQWAVCYYSMTHIINDWRTLFVSATYEEFDVTAAGLILTMDMNVYVADAQAAVQQYLGDDIKNKIKTAPVPKPTSSLALPRATGRNSLIINAPRPTSVSDNLQSHAVITRDIHDVSVLPMYGDPLLSNAGVGHIDFNGPNLTQLRCGVFADIRPIPTTGQDYRITGTYDDTNLPFAFTLRCTGAGRPVSYFAPAKNH